MKPAIRISTRAYSALLASCARTVLAHDAKPILASDIEPLLKGDWKRQRYAVEHMLACRLRGRLASDQSTPEDVSKRLMGMLDGEPDKTSEYAEQQFGRKPPVASGEEDHTDDSAVAKGKFGKDEDDDLASKVMALVSGKLSDEDCAALQAILDGNDDNEEDDYAEDVPPPFVGKPKNPTADTRTKLHSQAAMDSFNRRFPDCARIAGEPTPQYSNGTPVHDPRLLGNSTPAPRRAAMDSAPRRSTQSFEQRFPDAARIRSA